MRNQFEHILVMGAGAVGGFFGARLAERTDRQVTLIARGSHLEAIQRRGIEIQSPDGDTVTDVKAFEDPEQADPPDLVLFTVKSFDTAGAIRQLTPAVKEDTQILTIQNGIENYGRLKESFGPERVIQGYCQIGAGIVEPGVIEHKALGRIVAGEADGETTDRLQAMKRLFDEADIQFRISGDIWHDVWVKFAWNSIFNILTAVAEAKVGRLFQHEESEKLCRELFREIRAVAEKEGVQLTGRDEKDIIDGSKELTDFTTSTYRDRMEGKKLEFEAFTGAIVRRADRHGLEVPYNRTLYGLLKIMDGD